MDKIVSKIAALGVPGLILLIAINASGLYGAAAITVALSSIGPWGIIGGIGTLGLIGLITESISEYGFDAIVEAVLHELYKRGTTKGELKAKVRKFPISKSLKLKLYSLINKY